MIGNETYDKDKVDKEFLNDISQQFQYTVSDTIAHILAQVILKSVDEVLEEENEEYKNTDNIMQ